MKRSDIERTLRDFAADAELKALVNAGCNRDKILDLLRLKFVADESWEKEMRMDLRQFKAAIRQVQECAKTIDRLNASRLVWRVSIETPIPPFAALHQEPTLGKRLREYAAMMEKLRFMPKEKTGLHIWKALIVAVVIRDTKKPHDREVSSLISAVLSGDSPYLVGAHLAWRRKHGGLIEMMGKLHQEDTYPLPQPPSAA